MTGDTFFISSYPYGRDAPSLNEILHHPSLASINASNAVQRVGDQTELMESVEKAEYYCFFLDPNAMSESKLKTYLGMVSETALSDLKLSIRQFESTRGGFLLRALTFTGKL